METMTILQPVVVLIAWTLVMWIWMYATRIPAMNAAKIDSATWVGGTGGQLEDLLPAKVQWKAHNYNHLMEQPTIFYAVCLVLAIIGQGSGLNSSLAWGYVGFRILHSILQATVNRVIIRFILFALSTLCLIALTLHAVIAIF